MCIKSKYDHRKADGGKPQNFRTAGVKDLNFIIKDNIMKTDKNEPKVCPLCGRTYIEVPALSRKDNTILICPDCGTREALEAIGISAEKQEEILEIIHEKLGEREA